MDSKAMEKKLLADFLGLPPGDSDLSIISVYSLDRYENKIKANDVNSYA